MVKTTITIWVSHAMEDVLTDRQYKDMLMHLHDQYANDETLKNDWLEEKYSHLFLYEMTFASDRKRDEFFSEVESDWSMHCCKLAEEEADGLGYVKYELPMNML